MAFCFLSDDLRPSASFVVVRHPSQTVSAAQISGELFDLASPNFRRTSTPTCPTATPDITPLTTSGRKLPRKKTVENAACDGFWWNVSRTFKAKEDHKILQTCRGLTNLLEMTSLAASGRLQNAIKYCINVRKTGLTGIRVE